ncbi:hypothetical protein [Catellatospora methionotrophica]|uniref:hypothetical protein n=1 Tax=Catellatospora methionotrophica TaxID=121620 RepID=UPI0033DFF960
MRELIDARPWLRVYQLPLRPDLNPTENVWSNLRRSLANSTLGTAELAQSQDQPQTHANTTRRFNMPRAMVSAC